MDISRKSVDEIDAELDTEQKRKVEAALFIAGKFLSMQELVALTDVNPILLRRALDDLSEKYKDSGIEIVQKQDQWKMDVALPYASMVNRLATGSSEFSKAEQETLAIIAYKQSLKQSVLVKIRGNKSYEHIKKFVDLGLVHKRKMGHTAELSLTDEFHEYFHVGDDSAGNTIGKQKVVGSETEEGGEGAEQK